MSLCPVDPDRMRCFEPLVVVDGPATSCRAELDAEIALDGPVDVDERGRCRSDEIDSEVLGEFKVNLAKSGWIGDFRLPRLTMGSLDGPGGLSSHCSSSSQFSSVHDGSAWLLRGVSAFLPFGNASVGNSKSSSQTSVVFGVGRR